MTMRLKFKLAKKSKYLELTKSPLLFGRDSRADVAFRKRELELKNSLLVQFDKQWVLYDLRTQRRIICNDLAVSRCFLAPGQRLRFGGIRIDVEGGEEENISDSADTSIDMGLTAPTSAKLVFSGGWQGEYDISDDVLLGSGEECDIRLPINAGVSNRHAFIAWYGNEAHLFDLRSTNGVIHNGQKVKSIRLSDAGRVRLGKIKLELVRLPPSTSSAAIAALADPSVQSGPKPVFQPYDPPPVPSPAQTAFEEALRHFHQNKEKKAMEYLHRALELEPLETKFRTRLRAAQRVRFKDDPNKVSWFRKLLSKVDALKVKAARMVGDLPRALALSESALRRNPWNADVQYEEAIVFAEMERTRGIPPLATLWGLMSVRESNPSRMTDPLLNATIGNLLVDMKEYGKVQGVLTPALRQNPNDARLQAVLNRSGVERALIQQ
jgi:pSer/pThr/pTyr-binding forkhead associated (FHA) protein